MMKLPTTSSADSIVSVSGLSRRFGHKQALDDVSLHVPIGCVFGLVGENGAGKTTLIKHLMGLLRAEEGQVRVCGRDPVNDPVGVLSRVGYLSEYRDLPGWMRVDELLSYMQAFYPNWDPEFAEALREDLALDPSVRVRNLSQGQQAKAGLLVALAYRPELLVLDEPSSGLDPVVRRDMLEVMIRSVANEGRTVFFSSHLLDEIERVSDQLAMIHQGRIQLCGRLDEMREGHREFRLRFEEPQAKEPSFRTALRVTGEGKSWAVLCAGSGGDIVEEARRLGGQVVSDRVPTLDEIFFARADRQEKRVASVS